MSWTLGGYTRHEVASSATKTDLTLLLECLKYQMKCPDSQKQALLTIHSICKNREDNMDLFREMGGVVFVYNLSKSSVVHSDVKETALFTLGTLAESNVYCKQSLCRRETFSDLAGCLRQEDTTLTQRRVAVYLLSVLVANNKAGQMFAQTTGCLDILLDLFSTSYPLSVEGTRNPANVTQMYQLWTSVSIALCGCVNNPQNEEGQCVCVAAFPLVKTWLQQMILPRTEMVQPLCSFLAMTVANNSCVQESFCASGGLETLTLTLTRLASDATKSLLSCQLSVVMTKTLSACISNSSVLASGLAQHRLVPQLLSLLSSPNLDPQDRLPVMLTLGHCTEASEEHQSQLVQCGGLSAIISLLTEPHSEGLRKAATFVLQTCKQATMSLGGPSSRVTQGQVGALQTPTNLEGYWRSAKELLQRISQLGERQPEAEEREGDHNLPGPAEDLDHAGGVSEELPPSLPPALPPHSAPFWEGTVIGGSRERAVEIRKGRGDPSEVWLKGGDGEITDAGRQREEEDRMWTESREERWRMHKESTPIPSVEERNRREESGLWRDIKRGKEGGERCEEWRRESGVERRGREDVKADRNQRAEIQHRDRPLHLTDHVRKQIFLARDETQKSALANKVQEKRGSLTYSHQKDSHNRGCMPYTQTKSHVDENDDEECDTDLLSLRGAQREERDRHQESKKGNSYSCTQVDTDKSAHSQAEHHQVVEQQVCTHTLSSPAAHIGAGVQGQAPIGDGVPCSVCRGTGKLVTSTSQPLERAREPHKNGQVFKCPIHVKRITPKQRKCMDDEDALSLCSELLDSEMMMAPVVTHTPPSNRCSGCMFPFEEVTSRTFSALQSTCSYSCDMHKFLQEAMDRFRAHHRDTVPRRESEEHTVEQIDTRSEGTTEAQPQRNWDHCKGISLTPLHRRVLNRRVLNRRLTYHEERGVRLTPLKKPAPSEGPLHRRVLNRRVLNRRLTYHEERGVRLTPLKKPAPSEEKRRHHGEGDCALSGQLKTQSWKEPRSTQQEYGSQRHRERIHIEAEEELRRERRAFSYEEVCYLLKGFKRFGSSWNAILWSYPFQDGRTNVDLAEKYRRLQKAEVQDVGCD